MDHASARQSRRRSCPHFSAWRVSRTGRAREFVAVDEENEGTSPDLALDFQGLLRSALIGKASRARTNLRHERRPGRFAFLLSIASRKVDRRHHAVERYLKLAESFGAPIGQPFVFPLPTGDPLPRFDDYPPFILLHPFARGRGKSLSNAVIEEICRRFRPTRV